MTWGCATIACFGAFERDGEQSGSRPHIILCFSGGHFCARIWASTVHASSRRAAVSRGIVLALSLPAIFASFASTQTDTWLEVRTPHFVVISNSKENDARRVTRQFERMRAVFRKVFPDANLDPAPIVVLRRFITSTRTSSWRARANGYRCGSPKDGPSSTKTLKLSITKCASGKWTLLPLEFLQRNPLLPLATVLTVDLHSPYYHEDDKGSMFYAESWVLTHYLKTKDAREDTHRLLDYLDLVHKKVDSVTAATQAFGDLQELQTKLHKCIVNGDYSLLTMPGTTDVDDSTFAIRTLTQTQADTVRADFLAYNQRGEDARRLLEAVLRDDPSNVSAHETMGCIAFRQRNFEETRKWYEKAVQLDPQSFLAHYYFAVSVIKLSDAKKRLPDAAAQASIENSLRTALKLNPSFAPACDGLGVFLAMRGKGYSEGHQWTQKAIQMDPGNVEFRIDDANVLMRLNKDKDAIEELDWH
jgi:tetratricopeptide (TPR) repeat protein